MKRVVEGRTLTNETATRRGSFGAETPNGSPNILGPGSGRGLSAVGSG